jgi:hypothetical protein
MKPECKANKPDEQKQHTRLSLRVSQHNFIVLVKSRQAGERVMESLKRFLENTPKPRINPEKSRVVHITQAAFLGFTFRGAKIHWSEKAFREFKRKVKKLTGRSWFVSKDQGLLSVKELRVHIINIKLRFHCPATAR